MIDSVACNPEFSRSMQGQVSAVLSGTPYHSLELPGGCVVPGVVPLERLRERLDHYLPLRDLRGKRVLDIGAASGWNSFELEKRGASVVALDCIAYPEFHYAKRALDSKVELVVLDVDEISRERLGSFDYVLCFGVLYHLRHPLLALEKICSITREMAFIESYVIDPDASFPGCVMEFYETNELGGQIDNWWGPTAACLAALCRSAGFGTVENLYVRDRRAGLVCGRQWAQPLRAETAPPLLCFAVNNRYQDDCFSPPKDEYISITFKYADEIEKSGVLIEVDNLAVPLLSLAPIGPSRWQADVRVPPGLDEGRHAVRLRTTKSGYSNALAISVIPFETRGRYDRHSDSVALTAALLLVGPDPAQPVVRDPLAPMPIHFQCTGEGAGAAESITVEVDGVPAPVMAFGFVEEGVHQGNCRLPADLAVGSHEVRLRLCDGSYSNALRFRLEAPESEPMRQH
jgi:tRNA (mo5U34)-methyltransferase